MRITKASYIDDGVVINGVLIKRFLRKPIFCASDVTCGWDRQVITKAEEQNLIIWPCRAHEGKVCVFGGAKDPQQILNEEYDKTKHAYNEAIKATIDSGLAEKILQSDKAQALNHNFD